MMKAADVMTRDVITIKGSATVAEAIAIFKSKGIRTLIVERRTVEDAYGIVTDTDIVYKVTAFGLDPKAVRVYEIMNKPCIVVNPDLGVEYVARLFAQTGIRSAPVIKDKLLGMVSITDILIKGDFVEKPRSLTLEAAIKEAVQQARKVCAEKGPTSKDCAAAWDIVEELQAEAAHQRNERLPKTAFDEYCEEYPEAMEARVYEV
jgi:CBS domain-containing protein